LHLLQIFFTDARTFIFSFLRAKIAFLGTCLPAGRRSPEEFAWFLRPRAEKNSEGGEYKIRAGDFVRFPKSN